MKTGTDLPMRQPKATGLILVISDLDERDETINHQCFMKMKSFNKSGKMTNK